MGQRQANFSFWRQRLGGLLSLLGLDWGFFGVWIGCFGCWCCLGEHRESGLQIGRYEVVVIGVVGWVVVVGLEWDLGWEWEGGKEGGKLWLLLRKKGCWEKRLGLGCERK